MKQNNRTGHVKAGIYGIAMYALGLFGCGNSPTDPGKDEPKGEKPVLNGVVINDDATYTNNRNVTLGINYDGEADSVKVLGDRESPTGYQPITANTVDVKLTPEDGTKTLELILKNKSGESEKASDEIQYDGSKPEVKGIESIPNDVTGNTNVYILDLDLSDVVSGTYTLSGATTKEGNITDRDTLKLGEGLTTLEIYVMDRAGNDTTITRTFNLSKMDKEKGVNMAVYLLDSLGYDVKDSLVERGIPTADGKSTIYLTFDRSFGTSDPREEILFLYKDDGALSTEAQEAITNFNATFEGRAPKRIIYQEKSFDNELPKNLVEEIKTYKETQ